MPSVRRKKGERRQKNMPFSIDRLPAAVREQICELRAQGKGWIEIEALSPKFAGRRLGHSCLARWYDARVEQVEKEVLAEAEFSRKLITAFAAKGFKKIPEGTLNALASQAFRVVRAGKPKEREKSLSNLLFLTSKIMQAQASAKRADLEAERLEVERQKLKNVASKARGLAKDLGKKKLSEKELRQKLREIYGLAEEKG